MRSEETEQKITVYAIRRVHTKVVTVRLAENVEAVLPIKTPIYTQLIKIVDKQPRRQGWYPFVFWLDEKGYVTKILPLVMQKRLEQEAQKQDDEDELERNAQTQN